MHKNKSLPLRESLKKIFSSRNDKFYTFFFTISFIAFILFFIIILLIYNKTILSKASFIYLFLPFFLITAVTLSFGNILFSSLLFLLSGKLFSGESTYKKMTFAVSLSIIPLLIVLILTIPEINYLQKDLFIFKPKVITSIFLLNVHIFIYILKIIFILISGYILALSVSIVQALSIVKAILNILIGLLIPLILIFIFYLLVLVYFKSMN